MGVSHSHLVCTMLLLYMRVDRWYDMHVYGMSGQTLSKPASSFTAHVRQYCRSRGPRPPASRRDLHMMVDMEMGG